MARIPVGSVNNSVWFICDICGKHDWVWLMKKWVGTNRITAWCCSRCRKKFE